MSDSKELFKPIGAIAESVAVAANDAQNGENEEVRIGVPESERNIESLPTDISHGSDVMVLKSLCVACEETGVTRLLLTRIPFFRDIILMAFECEHCGYRNSEVQPAEVQDKGVTFTVTVADASDLNRQIVKSDRAIITIPELSFEIPSITQRGVFTTIEGLLNTAIDNLAAGQEIRRRIDPDSAAALDVFLEKLQACRDGISLPFTLILDDPSGNSFLENPHAPKHDPKLKVKFYSRSKEQNDSLGLHADAARMGVEEPEGTGAEAPAAESDAATNEEGDETMLVGSKAETMYSWKNSDGNIPSKFKKGGALIKNPSAAPSAGSSRLAPSSAGVVRSADGSLAGLIFDSSSSEAVKDLMTFPADCSHCSARGECRMCVTDVPHFKEVILMAFTCEECGWRDVEVKGGGAVPEKGTLSELRYDPTAADASEDMMRDVIKGDTASVEIPEIELFIEQGSLGGMYTTVEGLLTAVRDRLLENNPFVTTEATDSMRSDKAKEFNAFIDKLNALISGSEPFTLRLRDPMANTWVYSKHAPEPDPRLTHEEYTRTEQEEIDLGIHDMNTENYTDANEEHTETGNNAAST